MLLPDVVKNKVLVLDLDGTLLKTDSLWELFLIAIAGGNFSILFWLLRGRVEFKRRLAALHGYDLSLWPWNMEVLKLAKSWKAQGGEVWLATAANIVLAEHISRHFEFFAGVLGSDGTTNLKGKHKARALVEKFGEKGFAYAGDASCDLAIWQHCAAAYIVERHDKLYPQVVKICPEVHRIAGGVGGLKALFKAMRPHQWSKNALVLIAPLLAHDFSFFAFFYSFIAFIVFCLLASSGYLVNDLLDLETDRKHPKKKMRVFASGNCSLAHGAIGAGVLVFIALLLLPLFNSFFALLAFGYFTLTILYSLQFKRILLFDVVVLAILYSIRLVAGTVAIGAGLSIWILAFSFFVFGSLSLAKRIGEIIRLRGAQVAQSSRRGYTIEDASALAALDGGCICGATLTLALYSGEHNASVQYSAPSFLLLFCPIIFYWLARFLVLAHRGQMHYDPVSFALRDKQSLLCLSAGALIYAIASGWLL